MNQSLFPPESSSPDAPVSGKAPLADRMRPQQLEDFVGQEELLGEGRFLHEVIEGDQVPSLILWGPPGAGKTTLAHIIAHHTRSHFVALSAVLSGVKDVKKVVAEAQYQRRAFQRQTILFVDEIHRFNKAQQDAFLPHVEKGLITLIGATTENPSFEVISPLLSRTRVLVLQSLSAEALVSILKRALEDCGRGLGRLNLQVEPDILEQIALFADGDARVALNTLEVAASLAQRRDREGPRLDAALVKEAMQKRTLLYDRAGEEHFNLISALHKSLRNSDADAALYWLARMLEAGEDPLYVARRMVRFASEDVGLACPEALGIAVDAMRAVDFIGMPEGKLALAQLAVYLAQAPKSNSVYQAYSRVQRDVEQTRNDPVPLHLRNAPTRLMKELGYGRGYRYAHDEEAKVADMPCLPQNLEGKKYYHPSDVGFERDVAARFQKIQRQLRQSRKWKPERPE